MTPRLLKRMGLENLLLIISHWGSGRMSKTSKHDVPGRCVLTSRQQQPVGRRAVQVGDLNSQYLAFRNPHVSKVRHGAMQGLAERTSGGLTAPDTHQSLGDCQRASSFGLLSFHLQGLRGWSVRNRGGLKLMVGPWLWSRSPCRTVPMSAVVPCFLLL